MKRNTYWLLAACFVLVLALAGCFGAGSDSGGTDNSPDAVPTADHGDGGGSVISSGDSPVEDAAGEQVPDDVPVMPGAYNLDVIRSGTQVNYTVDNDVATVLAWYQTELEARGWMETRAPDSAIGAIGTMTRENEVGDKISLNMSFNQVNGATTIAIAISRED